MFSKVENETKNIYINQHLNYLKDESLFRRFYEWASKPESHGLPDGWLEGKDVLDLGCGNSAYMEKALCDLGANSITCLDIGNDWQGLLSTALESLNVDRSKFTFVGASCVELPFDDNSFDYVGAFGVLMHLETMEMINQSVREMNRVVKPSGYCYAYFGSGSHGILDKYIHKSLRTAYVSEPDFKSFIDNLSVDDLRKELVHILAKGLGNDPLFTEETISFLASMLTLDTTTYFQNLLQVPVQQGANYDTEYVDKMITQCGGTNIKDIPQTHYYQRRDFRRFLTPFHLSRVDSDYCRLMFGNGHIHKSWQKKSTNN